jgi:hypothetical protein
LEQRLGFFQSRTITAPAASELRPPPSSNTAEYKARRGRPGLGEGRKRQPDGTGSRVEVEGGPAAAAVGRGSGARPLGGRESRPGRLGLGEGGRASEPGIARLGTLGLIRIFLWDTRYFFTNSNLDCITEYLLCT